jgi:hypothetical protein
VKCEPRSNNAIAAGLSSFQGTKHHQDFDLARHPHKTRPTRKKLRPRDRQLQDDFVSEEEFDRLLRASFGNLARVLQPGRSYYLWGGYANCANYLPVLKACGLYFSQAIIWTKQHPVREDRDRNTKQPENDPSNLPTTIMPSVFMASFEAEHEDINNSHCYFSPSLMCIAASRCRRCSQESAQVVMGVRQKTFQ